MECCISSGHGSGHGSGGSDASSWRLPPIGTTVMVEVAEEEESSVRWLPAEVRAWQTEATAAGEHATFSACINGDEGFIEQYSRADEGVEWRRVMPEVGDAVEVEVEDDGEMEWRRAEVVEHKLVSNATTTGAGGDVDDAGAASAGAASESEFVVVVCFPDGTPDVDFVETFRLDSEGGEWRRLGKPSFEAA